MERHPRKSAELDVSDALGRLLATLRARAGVRGPAELDVDHVRDVEAGVGCLVPDAVLAIVAADVPKLRERLGMDLGRVLEHTAAAREAGARGDLVAFGAEPRRAFVAFAGGSGRDDVLELDARGRVVESLRPETWLARRVGVEPGDADPAGPVSFRLVRHVETVGTPPGARRAQHAKWGTGTVLAEHGEGPTRKVKVDFPGIGLKTVQARFLVLLDD